MGNSHPCGADPAILGEWSPTLTLGLISGLPVTRQQSAASVNSIILPRPEVYDYVGYDLSVRFHLDATRASRGEHSAHRTAQHLFTGDGRTRGNRAAERLESKVA